MSLKKFIEMLPDLFNKKEKSNIGKLMLIFEEQTDVLNDVLNKSLEWRSIDKAQGIALNELGNNVGQNRGLASDEIYRVLIRGKVARNFSDGTLNRILEALSISLNCPPSEIHIESSIESGDNEPAAISIKRMPLECLNKSGLTATQFFQITESITSGGVQIAFINLEGTFYFAGNEIEESEEGFADLEETFGGTLGGVFLPENDYKLPL